MPGRPRQWKLSPNPKTDAPLITPELIKITRPAKSIHVPDLLAWLVIGFVLFVFVVLALPGGSRVQVRGIQTKALVQAKQVGLALRLFADDHNGVYPRRGVPVEMTAAPTDSNTVFACLFPTYITSETIFGNKLSAYQTAQPDNVIDPVYTGQPKETLQPGENVYAYVMGLTDHDDPRTPLVADGTGGTGFYNSDATARGGTWKGARAIIINLDNSGMLANLTGPSDARFVAAPTPAVPGHVPGTNLLDFSHAGTDQRLLDPAVGPRRH